MATKQYRTVNDTKELYYSLFHPVRAFTGEMYLTSALSFSAFVVPSITEN